MQDEQNQQPREVEDAAAGAIPSASTEVAPDLISVDAGEQPTVLPYPFWDWLDAVMFGVVLVAFLVTTVLLSSVAHLFGLVRMAPAAIAAQGIAMGASLFALSKLLRYRYGVGLRAALHLDAPRQVLLYCGLGLITAVLVSILGYVLKLSEMDMPMKDFIRTDLDLLVVGIGAVTFGPLFEELIFRGFLQPLFGRLVGMIPGIFATSLLFALPHGPQYGWHWQHLVVITAAGAVFGFIRWRAASTTASTIAHSAYNGFLVIAAFVQRAQELGP